MKTTVSIITLTGLFIFSACDKTGKDTASNFDNDNQKLGYSIGIDIGRNIEKAAIDSLDVESMVAAIRDVLAKKDLKISDEESKKFIMDYFQKKQQSDLVQKGAKAKKFFADNAKKEGVVTLPSGLQYQIITPGNGPKPTINDQVTVDYHGTLLDGKVFDSSVERGDPATFPVGGVITGWTEALTLMPVGSKWKLFIPSNLAYGETGAGGTIGPNEALVFEVDLKAIVK